MHFLQDINSDLSVLIVCNKTGGTIKGDIKKHIISEELRGHNRRTLRLLVTQYILKPHYIGINFNVHSPRFYHSDFPTFRVYFFYVCRVFPMRATRPDIMLNLYKFVLFFVKVRINSVKIYTVLNLASFNL